MMWILSVLNKFVTQHKYQISRSCAWSFFKNMAKLTFSSESEFANSEIAFETPNFCAKFLTNNFQSSCNFFISISLPHIFDGINLVVSSDRLKTSLDRFVNVYFRFSRYDDYANFIISFHSHLIVSKSNLTLRYRYEWISILVSLFELCVLIYNNFSFHLLSLNRHRLTDNG